jgi:hypothetical protein
MTQDHPEWPLRIIFRSGRKSQQNPKSTNARDNRGLRHIFRRSIPLKIP